ncbi:pseudouridine synthase [Aquabacterium sp. OR-4]|uniref:pseudouridine synthase n=1 Tax=Aquabacterium sp. OR-4 TaxID=2978127 RepID=UPI0021B4A2DA|nr:pseudouridine synthase [Aquabacterium sp. OR-4]MDT7837378.1 pseudouridine synthase [Aquabacterium sp. OR-4]
MSTHKTKPGKPERLDELLFSQGFGTRRVCAGLIEQGLVRVHDETVTDPGALFAADGLVLEVEGQAWPVQATALVLLNKPAGYECSQKPGAWPSVMLLLPPPLRTRGVQPVGRLDQDTTGALLLTDDGSLIHRLTSPKHHVPKVYEVHTARPVDEAQVKRLREGVVLLDDPVAVHAEGCEIIGPQHLRLTLVQGKYHQVKRMVAAVGNHCEALHRSGFGAIAVPEPPAEADPAPGRWRFVSAAERAALLAAGKGGGKPAPAAG